MTSRLPEGTPSWRGWIADHELREPDGDAWPRARWLAEAADAEALVCLLGDRVDDAALAALPRLRVVANYAVGYDNVDLAAATARGVTVTNTPDVLTEATADFTWALLLAAARRLGDGERLVRAGAWRGWTPELLLGAELGGRTLGIVGLGRIGAAVARRAHGFGMRVIAADTRGGTPAAPGVTGITLDALLAEADVISLHCPLFEENRGMIDAKAIARMKPTAILINTSRGPLVNEADLAAALNSGRLAGAALDVLSSEPPTPDNPLLTAKNCIVTPHIAWATREARSRMMGTAEDNLAAFLAGTPINVVNP